MNCSVCGQPNPQDARFCQACGAPFVQDADGPDLIGKLVGGRYRITRLIGEGGMGVVYEAAQQMGPHTRRVAVKTLLPSLSADHTVVSRFYRECGIVAQLEHPNTIRLYDFGETPDKRLYIAMEYVDGEPLTQLIARGPVPLERTRRILRQICGALAEAHALGIVHRDLKPDNIILTHRAGEEDFVKVLDFGIAKTTDASALSQTKLTQQGVVLGTPPYMSPEQLAGKELDLRSDVYSLGIIAYEMLTGRLPFQADTPFQWAAHHMTTPPPPLTTVTSAPIPADVERAVMHALEKLPEDRPKTAVDFQRELSGTAASPARTEPEVVHAEPHTSPMEPPIRGERGQTQRAPVAIAYATGAAVAAPIPPPPVRRRRSRTGAWLASLGLLLGGAFAALAAWSYYYDTPQTTPASPLPVPAPAPSSSVVLVEPEVEVPPTPVAPPPPPEPAEPEPKTKPTPKKPTPAPLPPPPTPQQPKPQPQPQPQPQQPPPPPPPPVQPPPSGQGDALCAQSRQQAQAKNIEAAASLLQQCQASGGSASAVGAARIEIGRNAPDAVRSRAFRGDCAGAKSAVNAANSVGAGGRAQATYSTTSCAGK